MESTSIYYTDAKLLDYNNVLRLNKKKSMQITIYYKQNE